MAQNGVTSWIAVGSGDELRLVPVQSVDDLPDVKLESGDAPSSYLSVKAEPSDEEDSNVPTTSRGKKAHRPQVAKRSKKLPGTMMRTGDVEGMPSALKECFVKLKRIEGLIESNNKVHKSPANGKSATNRKQNAGQGARAKNRKVNSSASEDAMITQALTKRKRIADVPVQPIKIEPESDDEMSVSSGATVSASGRPPMEPNNNLSQLNLMPCVNISHAPELRTMYMGENGVEEWWLNLIAKRFGDNKSFVYQCFFCPHTAPLPKIISDHMETDHEELGFAVNRSKRAGACRLTYFFCRHCDFVASESVIVWIHYETYHGVNGILDGGGEATNVKPDMDDPFKPVAATMQVAFKPMFACLDCNGVTENKRQLAHHIVRDHVDTEHFNGFFVKAVQIQKTAAAATGVTFHEALTAAEHAGLRKECFICFLCNFVAHDSYLAISHYVKTHQQMRMIQVCMHRNVGSQSNCDRQYQGEKEFTDHMRLDHTESNITGLFHCSVTLVTPAEANGRSLAGATVIECPVSNRGSTVTKKVHQNGI